MPRDPTKIKHLLRALDHLGVSVDYFALDLCLLELQRSLGILRSEGFSHVCCHGLLGTYADLRAWIQLPENVQRSKCMISLGSSIGNLRPPEAVQFLSGYAEILRRSEPRSEEHQVQPKTLFIIGLDSCKSAETIHRAYNDLGGVNARFNMNSLEHANQVLGYKAFRTEEWTVQGEWDERARCFSHSLVPLRDVRFEDVFLKAGEKVHISHSYKYDALQKGRLWQQAGLRELAAWRCKDPSYGESPFPPPSSVEYNRKLAA
jgi:L-histidine Nalpha-methyltransferase / hercynylcysteine S-oxide synthase